jgi:S1-C subfamily serine protease/tetratricopeptide (TPR) repeat protein/thiol-disulfide isomerase/thioredoxin
MGVTRRWAVVLLLLFAAGGLWGDDEHSNRPAPDFTLADSAGRPHDIAKYRGKTVLLDFMATRLPHCRTVIAALQQIEARYRGQVVVLSVVIPPDTIETAQKFIREERLTSPILMDDGRVTASYVEATPQNASITFPHLFVIDASGMIRADFVWSGSTDRNDANALEQRLAACVNRAMGAGSGGSIPSGEPAVPAAGTPDRGGQRPPDNPYGVVDPATLPNAGVRYGELQPGSEQPGTQVPPPSAPPSFQPLAVGRLAKDGDTLYTVSQPSPPGLYEDPAQLMSIRFPADWRVARAIGHDAVQYVFSAEAGRVPPSHITTGVEVNPVVLGAVQRRQGVTATEVAKLLLPNYLSRHPGTRVTTGISSGKLGKLDAATYTIEGPDEDVGDLITRNLWFAIQGGVLFELNAFSPTREYAAMQPVFEKIRTESRLGRDTLPRQERSYEPRQILDKYTAAVVGIVANDEQGPVGAGSGFIISREGYILTNYHVVYDLGTGRPLKSFTVEWDQSLRRPRVAAQLIGAVYKVRNSPLPTLYGTDVALLKIPAGDYEPLPLSPLSDVHTGDGIVTMGFPQKWRMEGVSITSTTGVVARFNRGPEGDVESIYTDAPFTHGSSGGPSVSLVTGGVIGLDTFGMDIQTDSSRAGLNDLVSYKGIVPIDIAIREFPLYTIPGLDPSGGNADFIGSLAITKYLLDIGSLSAAEAMTNRAVSLQPQQPLGHMRLGDVRARQAVEAQEKGDTQRAAALFDAARRSYEQALQRDPNHSDTLAAYARLETAQGRLKEAIALATRAVASNPKDYHSHILLAGLYARQSQFQEALAEIQKAKDITGSVIVDPYVTAANIYGMAKDPENARKEWAAAARISPTFLPARLGEAAYFQEAKQFDGAIQEYNRILNDFPQNPEVLGKLGLCQLLAGKQAEALRNLEESFTRYKAVGEPADESVLLNLGNVLMQQSSGQAIPVLIQYIALYPNGRFAAAESLNLGAILLHLQEPAPGLAYAHAQLAMRLNQDQETAARARQFAAVPLSLKEVGMMLQLDYPPNLTINLVLNATLASPVNDQDLMQMPGWLASAIRQSLGNHPPQAGLAGAGGLSPSGAMPQGGGSFPPVGNGPASGPGSLLGTWIADGTLQQGQPYRCMIIFGDAGAYGLGVWIGGQQTENSGGTYQVVNGRLILQPDGAGPFDANAQMQGDQLILSLPSFSNPLTFLRQNNPGGRLPL